MKEKKIKKKEKKTDEGAPDEKKKEKKTAAPKVKEDKKIKPKTVTTLVGDIEGGFDGEPKLRNRAKTIDQPQAENAGFDDETPSSDKDDEEEEKECQAAPKGKHCCNKSGALPPRKSIKKLIMSELEKSAP